MKHANFSILIALLGITILMFQQTVLTYSGEDNIVQEKSLTMNENDDVPAHWIFTSNTGNSAIVILPLSANPTINGNLLLDGDYIGAFTPAGLCCGWKQWTGQNMSITIWGDDDQTPGIIDGFQAGEEIAYRIYRADTEKEWASVTVEYLQGDGNYAANAFMVLSKFEILEEISLPENWNVLSNTGNSATIVIPLDANPTVDDVPLANGDYIGAFSPAGLCCGWKQWQGGNLSITAWGDDDQTSEVDGFQEDEQIKYRVFQVSTAIEWNMVAVTYSQGNGIYTADAFMVVSQFNAFAGKCINVDLVKGWNMFSINVNPPILNMETVFEPIESQLVIIKNNGGHSYIPGFEINEIGELNNSEGYKAFLKEDASFELCGLAIDPLTPIYLNAGWNMVSYLPDNPINITTALGSIAENLILAKNNDGENYIPLYEIDEIDEMEPGQGYKLYMSSLDTLIYPTGSENNVISQLAGSRENIRRSTAPLNYFQPIELTSENATLVIPSKTELCFSDGSQMKPGDEIGVFSGDGQCCGAVVWHGNNVAITIWGKMEHDNSAKGLMPGDAFSLKVWRQHDKQEYFSTITLKNDALCIFKPDAFFVLNDMIITQSSDNKVSEIPHKFQLKQSYPNPFNMETNITFEIPQTANIKLTIFDLQGHEVRRLMNETQQKGQYLLKWDGTDDSGQQVASGVYFYKIKVNHEDGNFAGYHDSKKLILLK